MQDAFRYEGTECFLSIFLASRRNEYNSCHRRLIIAIEDRQNLLVSADAKTYHSVLRLDRGCPWESALESRNAYIQECNNQNVPPSAKSGFYIDKKKHGRDGETSDTDMAIDRPASVVM